MNSVHLQTFPKVNIVVDNAVANAMDMVRDICNCAFSLRKEANIRVRMPLSKITICGDFNIDKNYLEIIKQEINVKNIVLYEGNIDEIATKEIILNMKECGKQFGSKLKDILLAQKNNDWTILENGNLMISNVEIDVSLFEVKYKPIDGSLAMQCSSYNILVILDTTITKELMLEGLSRDLIRIIQQTRKDNGLEILDRINIEIFTKDDIFNSVIDLWSSFIKDQTLADNIALSNQTDNIEMNNIDNYSFGIKITKI